MRQVGWSSVPMANCPLGVAEYRLDGTQCMAVEIRSWFRPKSKHSTPVALVVQNHFVSFASTTGTECRTAGSPCDFSRRKGHHE